VLGTIRKWLVLSGVVPKAGETVTWVAVFETIVLDCAEPVPLVIEMVSLAKALVVHDWVVSLRVVEVFEPEDVPVAPVAAPLYPIPDASLISPGAPFHDDSSNFQ